MASGSSDQLFVLCLLFLLVSGFDMSDIMDDIDLIIRKMEEMSWESLPRFILLDLDLAHHTSSTVLIGKIFGLRPLVRLLSWGLFLLFGNLL